METSKHAQQRSKERNGWNVKATERMIPRILEKGIRHSQTKGNLHKWMSGLYERYKVKGTDIRIYGDKAYVFRNECLVTVLQVPNNILKHKDSLIREE